MDVSVIKFLHDMIALPLLACAISAVMVWLSIRYACARHLVDQPGQRRSHATATPRGGGIGIVCAVLLCFSLPLLAVDVYPLWLRIGAAVALLAVAVIGWWDDHRPLSAILRICVHFMAALLIALPLVIGLAPSVGWMSVVLLALLVLATVWSINLHNFMDGINGLLACQALFVFVVFGIQCALMRQSILASLLLVLAAATAGFLPFNFPRAYIFMGDVGSGTLGLLIALAAWLGIAIGAFDVFFALAACSAFIVDASCTLLSRLCTGRRWYSAHREHLYQWLVRCGWSHATVVGCYMSWNLWVGLPMLYVLRTLTLPASAAWHGEAIALPPVRALALVGAMYIVAVVLWLIGKRWCLRKI